MLDGSIIAIMKVGKKFIVFAHRQTTDGRLEIAEDALQNIQNLLDLHGDKCTSDLQVNFTTKNALYQSNLKEKRTTVRSHGKMWGFFNVKYHIETRRWVRNVRRLHVDVKETTGEAKAIAGLIQAINRASGAGATTSSKAGPSELREPVTFHIVTESGGHTIINNFAGDHVVVGNDRLGPHHCTSGPARNFARGQELRIDADQMAPMSQEVLTELASGLIDTMGDEFDETDDTADYITVSELPLDE